MSPEQILALLALLADLRLQITAQAAENAELRRRLDLVSGAAKADDAALADLARSLDAIA